MEMMVMFIGAVAAVILGGAVILLWNARRMATALNKHRS